MMDRNERRKIKPFQNAMISKEEYERIKSYPEKKKRGKKEGIYKIILKHNSISE